MTSSNLSKGKSSRFDFLDDTSSVRESVSNQNNNSSVHAGSPRKSQLQPEVDSRMLLEDGVFRSSRRVLPRSSKMGGSDNSYKKYTDEPAVKAFSQEGTKQSDKKDLKSIRSKVGFNWKQISRKLAITGVIFGLVFALLFAGVAAWAISQYNGAPNISEGNLFNVKENSVVYARDGKTKIFEFFGKDQKREYISVEKIPEVMQLAIIGLEDENFYYNPDGIPWSNLAGAVAECVRGGFTDCRGGSGLSQQLVKNVQQDAENTPDRKIRELFTALKLTNEGTRQDGRSVNKSDILELYLNWVSFGRNSNGVQAASRAYFGHDVDAKNEQGEYLLNPAEACFLAALPQQPTAFANSIGNPESAKYREFNARKNSCLFKLAGDGRNFSLRGDGQPLFIETAEDLQKWQEAEVTFVENRVDDPYPHFREYIDMEITKFLDSVGLPRDALYKNGLKIVTTLDPDLQKKTQDVFQGSRDRIRAVNGDNAAGVVLDGPTGEILAMVGSLDYNDKSIDGNVNILLTPQQPGSSIKPMVYANLFDKGFNPGTVLMDNRTRFVVDPRNPNAVFEPKNFSERYRGPTTIHYALSNSLNIPAVKAGYLAAGSGNYDLRKSLDTFFDFNETIGDRFYDGNETGAEAAYRRRCFSGSFIGGCEVLPIAHATAVNTLLQQGNLRTATPFISIKDKFDRELFTPENRNKIYPVQDRVIKPEVARQTALVMADQNRPEFGQFQRNFTIPGWNLAGKTGTTDDNRDTWMVGGSPLYTTVVWAGRTDNQAMARNVQASNLALPIWNSIQQALHSGKKNVEWSTQGLKQVKLNPTSGFPDEGGNPEWLSAEQEQILQEAGARIAKPDFDPRKTTIFETRSSVVPRRVKINKVDGKLAVEGKTLPENIEEKTCFDFLGEFPGIPNWRDPVDAWAGSNPNRCGELTPSEQDQVSARNSQPTITVNGLNSGQPMPSSVSAQFSVPGNGSNITSANIKINGSVVKNYSDSTGVPQISLSLSLQEALAAAGGSQSVTVALEVITAAGSSNSRTIPDVKLIPGSGDDNNTSSPNSSTPTTGANRQISLTVLSNPASIGSPLTVRINTNQSGPSLRGVFYRVVLAQDRKTSDCRTFINGFVGQTQAECTLTVDRNQFRAGTATVRLENGEATPVQIRLI